MTISSSDRPRTEEEAFTRTGEWTEIESDREGMRCASSKQDTIAGMMTLKAYFASSGNLAALSVTTRDGQVMEYDPKHVALLAHQMLPSEEAPPLSRTLGRGKFSTRG